MHKLDYRKKQDSEACVEQVQSFKCVGVHHSENLSRSVNTSAMMKNARQRLYLLRVLRRNSMEKTLLFSFYKAAVESILNLLHHSVEFRQLDNRTKISAEW